MKRFFLLLAVVVAALQVSAGNVDLMSAQAKAAEFLKFQTTRGKLAAPQLQFVSQKIISNSANVTVPALYIFNTTDRFVIVSGEDRAEEILAVGDAPIDFNNIPANMQVWLDYYQRQIEYLQAHPGLVVEKMRAPSRAQNVSPLLTARWDQTAPFYNQCVINGTQCLTGCPATSLAQVFYYWKYPTAETGVVPAYRFNKGSYWNPSWVNVASLPSTTFDWANMRDYYGWSGGSGTAAQKAAVATLMRYVGQAEHMEYGASGSGISSDSTVLIANACKFFGYDSNVRAIKKTSYYGTQYYSDSQWASLIQAELEAGHPIVYCAISDEGEGGGHAFNVDGYTVSSNKYHINWGWSGTGNGDFALNAFTDYDGWTFDIYQQMVIGIQPPGGQVTFPVLTVDPESLDFGSIYTGESVTRTFTVSGENILGDVTLKSSNVAYSVSPATLTAAEVIAGAIVTVTYAPTSGGTHTGKITVSGGAAEEIEVNLTGTATVKPRIVVEPSEVNLEAAVGESVTSTFKVTGYNLEKTLYLTLQNNSGSVFTIDKANITKAAAAAGVDVTVTYSPRAAGTTNARVMLRSVNADTVYVALNGTATLVFDKYDPVMQPASDVTTSSFRASWTDQTIAAGVTSYTLECTGDGNTFTKADLTNKNYLLDNLTAGATYSFKVKTLYADGTWSAWSNTQQVTLEQEITIILGDVNDDGQVSIADVTALIDYLLGGVGTEINVLAADVNGDSGITIADVTALIDILLGSN